VKVVQILTPNNNNLKKTTAIMLESKNYPYSGIIFGLEQYQLLLLLFKFKRRKKGRKIINRKKEH